MPRVYLSFFARADATGDHWICSFLDNDLTRPVGRPRSYANSETLLGLIERGGGFRDLAARQAIDAAIRLGRGGVYLNLTNEQYQKLRTLGS